MVRYTAQVVDPAGSAVRDLPVLFGSSRRMQLSLGIQLRAQLYQIVLECELIHDFLCNMAIPTDGNNLITIYKPLNFCTVSDNMNDTGGRKFKSCHNLLVLRPLLISLDELNSIRQHSEFLSG